MGESGITSSSISDNYDSLTDNGRRIQIYVKDIDYVSRSIVFFQIAVAIYIFILITTATILFSYHTTIRPNLNFREYFFLLTIKNLMQILALCMITIGIVRICYFLRKEANKVFLLSAVALIVFFLGLECVDLCYFINILTIRRTSISSFQILQFRPALFLIITPITIFSFYIIALRLNKHFKFKPDRTRQINLISATIGIIWLLRIIIDVDQWMQDRKIYGFSIHYLVGYYYKWEAESLYNYFYLFNHILVILWFIWLLIVLRLIKFSRIELPESYKNLVVN